MAVEVVDASAPAALLFGEPEAERVADRLGSWLTSTGDNWYVRVVSHLASGIPSKPIYDMFDLGNTVINKYLTHVENPWLFINERATKPVSWPSIFIQFLLKF